jgi:hypothetical protein
MEEREWDEEDESNEDFRKRMGLRPKRKYMYISEDLTLPTPEIPHRGWGDIFEDNLPGVNQ